MNGAVAVRHCRNQMLHARRWMPSWKNRRLMPSQKILWWSVVYGPEALAEQAGTTAAGKRGRKPLSKATAARLVGHFDGSAHDGPQRLLSPSVQLPGPNRLYCDPYRADGGKRRLTEWFKRHFHHGCRNTESLSCANDWAARICTLLFKHLCSRRASGIALRLVPPW